MGRKNRQAVKTSAIQLGIDVLNKHPLVDAIVSIAEIPEALTIEAVVNLCVRLPSAWMAEAKSPNGIMNIEPVTFLFPPNYPIHAPVVKLRKDFNRSFPHIQPGSTDSAPIPCIYEGDINELFHNEGLWSIVNQLVDWLEKAARDELIDPIQGWEPIRRDILQDIVVADSNILRGLVTSKSSFHFFQFVYLKMPLLQEGDGHAPYFLHGEIQDQTKVNKLTFRDRFQELSFQRGTTTGRSLAIVATPGKLSSGKPHIADQYHPEDVTDLASLQQRAEEYGCANSLKEALSHLQLCAEDFRCTASFPVIVILCARRPYNLIGQPSNIELIPYRLEIKAPRLFSTKNDTHVFPVSHREAISPALLQQFSVERSSTQSQRLICVGCGSLGSKIVLHLARAGTAPIAVIDKGVLSPHNAARYALAPVAGVMQLSWLGAKSQAIADAITGLGQTTKAFQEDVTGVVSDSELLKKLFPANTWAVVNSTASLAVREALASISPNKMDARVIETCLFAKGEIGLITVEGPNRNPNSMDLIAEAYETMRPLVFEEDNPIGRRTIGQGCSSVTMVMPDSRVSLFAASMTEGITTWRDQGFSKTSGSILLGKVTDDRMSLHWLSTEVPPVQIVHVDDCPWSIRLSDRAHQKILAECAVHPDVETGGILVGRISESMQAFLVTDVLPAPPNSSRSSNSFTLGTEEGNEVLQQYRESCQSTLYDVGTWHSHLTDTGPSDIDNATAAKIARSRVLPAILLIKPPSRYRAILASLPPSQHLINAHG
jgi:proteasome lid subunit RPN8/RPN11